MSSTAVGKSPRKDNKQAPEENFNQKSEEALAKTSSNKTLP